MGAPAACTAGPARGVVAPLLTCMAAPPTAFSGSGGARLPGGERRVLVAWGPRLLGAQQAGTRERGRVWARAGRLWRRKARSQGDPVHAAADGVRPSGDVSVS